MTPIFPVWSDFLSRALAMFTSNVSVDSLDPCRTHLNFDNRVFPKIDHSDIDARIVLEQNKFSKKTTSNRT